MVVVAVVLVVASSTPHATLGLSPHFPNFCRIRTDVGRILPIDGKLVWHLRAPPVGGRWTRSSQCVRWDGVTSPWFSRSLAPSRPRASAGEIF